MLRVYIKPPGEDWVEYTPVVRPDRTFEIGGRAYNGEADQGEITVDDPDYTLDVYEELASGREVKITVDDSGSEKVLALGRIVAKSMERGSHRIGREVTFSIDDVNSELKNIIVNKWGRPAESGLNRVKALRLSHLRGSLSTSTFARDSTNIDIDDFVPTADEITMPAKFYEGTDPLSIIRECAEWEGKLFFVYPKDNGDKELFYARPNDLTLHNCTLEVSDDPTDIDYAMVFPIAWVAGPALSMNGQETRTGILFIHPDGERTYDNDAAAEALYDKQEEAMFVDEPPGTAADAHLAAVIAARNHEDVRRQGALQLPESKVHLIKQGMLLHVIQANAAAVPNVTGGSQKYRIAQVRYRWLGPHADDDNDFYVIVTLEVVHKLFRHWGPSKPGATSKPPTPTPAPPQDPQPEDTITTIAHWQWNATHGTLDDTDTYDSNITRDDSLHTWTGPPAGSIPADHGDCGNSGEIFDAVPVTAGTTVTVTIGKFRWKWGPHPLSMNFYSTTDGTGSAIETWTFESGAGKTTNVLYTDAIGGTHLAPVGTQSVRIHFSPGLGLSVVDDVTIGTVDPADEVVNDPHAVNYAAYPDCEHDSPHFLPSDFVLCQLQALQDQITAGAAFVKRTLGGEEGLVTDIASGAAHTIDLTDGNGQDITLTDDCTFTFPTVTDDTLCSFTLLLRQDGTGSREATWPGSVVWPGGSAPTLATAAGAVDILGFLTVDSGTTWYGLTTGGGSALTVEDEGTPLATDATTLDFVGAGVTATGAGAEKTITIPGTPTGSAGGDLSGTYPNPSVVDDSHSHTTATAPGGGNGQILLESGHAVPFTFDEILQESDGSDFLWASE